MIQIILDQDQALAVQIAKAGHNLCLTGPPGTGKSSAIVEIVKCLRRGKKKVAVTASTGKAACALSEKGIQGTITVHSFCGLKDNRYDKKELLKRTLNPIQYNIEDVVKNIAQTDVLVVDEVSMISMATFERMDVVCRAAKGKLDIFFGGIQVIVVGDFRQLPPIPSVKYGDGGEYAFQSRIFLAGIRHHVDLKKVHRQEEIDLCTAVWELQVGNISLGTSNLLRRLKRPLPPPKDDSSPDTFIFALNIDVEICNSRFLLDLPACPSTSSATQPKKSVMDDTQPTGTESVVDARVPDRVDDTGCQWPCGVCSMNCPDGAIECSICLTWFYFTCVNVTEDTIAEDEEWLCYRCNK